MLNPTGAHSLQSNERGAIMVLATFMAVFLAASLFYLFGVAEAALHRSAIQDAADAVAFSAAVMHAKGMNLLGMVNFVMAALMATLVALRIVQTVATAAALSLAAMSIWVPPAASGAAKMVAIAKQAETQFNTNKRPIYARIRMVNKFGHSLSRAMPVAAQARAIATGITAHKPDVVFGAAMPDAWQLPIENGKLEKLCREAAVLAVDLALKPITAPLEYIAPEPVPSLIEDLTKGPIGALAESAPAWFCGTGKGRAPRITHDIERGLPELAAARACREATESGNADVQAKCDAAKQESDAAAVHDTTGDCLRQCGPDGPYQTRIVAAREACFPGNRQGLFGFEWQERWLQKEFRFDGMRYAPTGRERVSDVKRKTGNRPPCMNRGKTTWNPDLTDPSTGLALPLCTLDQSPLPRVPSARRGRERPRSTLWVDVHEVSQILSCKFKDEVEIKPKTGGGPRSSRATPGQGKLLPLQLKGGLQQGQAPFQLRALAIGAELSDRPDKLVAVASRGAPNGTLDAARTAGRLGLAQAEYYFDTDKAVTSQAMREEALWNMAWTARLRRFRMPQAGGQGAGKGEPTQGRTGGSRRSSQASAARKRPGGRRGLRQKCAVPAACGLLSNPALDDLIVH